MRDEGFRLAVCALADDRSRRNGETDEHDGAKPDRDHHVQDCKSRL
jgi:hypothetical protein